MISGFRQVESVGYRYNSNILMSEILFNLVAIFLKIGISLVTDAIFFEIGIY